MDEVLRTNVIKLCLLSLEHKERQQNSIFFDAKTPAFQSIILQVVSAASPMPVL